MVTAKLHLADLVLVRGNGESLSEARQSVPRAFAGRPARRMTHLGTLMARILAEREGVAGHPIIYGTTYAETRSLEDYVDSFPSPSPLLFQGSIHPSAVQQVFVHRKLPIGAFFPLTGSTHLVATILETALRMAGGPVTVSGGEERGTWLLERGKASSEAFAWAFRLAPDMDGAVATLEVDPDDATDGSIGHTGFFSALESRSPVRIPRPGGGAFRIEWR